MATVTRKLGPADDGRPLSYDDFMTAEYREGFRHELIDGRLAVGAQPNLRHDRYQEWLSFPLRVYVRQFPDVINYVGSAARVFVPGRDATTCPAPDVAAYRNLPLDLPLDAVGWQDVSPLLVAEVLSPDNPEKDLERNVELYLLVPSIKEYWILDHLADAERPTLHVYRRQGRRWRVLRYGYGETYTTKLLPGFELVIDPRR
jgi:Uma2 family endonuclease